jgi:RimJ/RimL family protein N-acetyltransferase
MIRRATATDVNQVQALRLEALQQHPTFFIADYDTERDKPLTVWAQEIEAAIVYVASLEDQLIGMARLCRGSSSKIQHKGELRDIYVRPAYRGYRIAQQLVQACITWAQNHEMHVVTLFVATSNRSAIQCYKRCQFVITGIEHKALRYNGVLYDEFMMTRHL